MLLQYKLLAKNNIDGSLRNESNDRVHMISIAGESCIIEVEVACDIVGRCSVIYNLINTDSRE